MELHEALQDIEIAFTQLEFTIKLLSFCELKEIDPAKFDTDHVVLLKNGNLNFPIGHFSDADNIIRAASVSVLLAFAATALALDQAFDVKGIRPNPKADDNIGQLRTLIYMVRCAYAHRIADPHWEVNERYRRTIVVDLEGARIFLDLRPLNGQAFNVDEHLGGHRNWYRLRDAAIQILAN